MSAAPRRWTVAAAATLAAWCALMLAVRRAPSITDDQHGWRQADTQAIAPRLKDIVAPAAIVWGQHDPFLSVALAERLRAAIPGATLDVISSARHFTPEECPNKVGDVLKGLLKR